MGNFVVEGKERDFISLGPREWGGDHEQAFFFLTDLGEEVGPLRGGKLWVAEDVLGFIVDYVG